jgi:hypothetical protein
MEMKTHRTVRAALAVLVLLPVLVPAPVRAQEEDQELLRISSRLLSEERRQGQVNRRMTGVIQTVDWLIADLQSNQLFKQGKGTTVKGMNTTLTTVNEKHVPKAELHLRLARKEIRKMGTHLDVSDREIDSILRQLKTLLTETELAGLGNVLLPHLRDIIKAEEKLRKQTAEWGKQIYTEPEKARARQEQLAQRQKNVQEQLQDFQNRLAQAAARETDPGQNDRFEETKRVLQERKPQTPMGQAAEDIASQKPISAVQHQDEALEALKEAERQLSGEAQNQLAAMAQARDDLQQILNDQRGLHQDVAQTRRQDFPGQQAEFEGRQMELGNQLEQSREQAAPHEGMPSEHMENAQEAMRNAERSLGESQQHNAQQQQQQAISNLEKALDSLNQAISQMDSGERQEGMQGEYDPSEQGQPGEPGQQGEQAQASQPDQSQQPGQQPSQQPGMQPGMQPSMQPSLQPSMQPSLMPGQPIPFQGNPTDDRPPAPPQGTSSTVVKGDDVERTRMLINTFDKKKRGAMFQKYVNQLPVEFRRQVADYYEVLAE